MQPGLSDSQGMAERLPLDDRLLSLYYAEFRQIARRVLGANNAQITLQPTDLVHEAALRLLAGSGVWIRDEAHFLALGARVIRTTLIDEIRRRKAVKRDVEVLTIWDGDGAAPLDLEQVDALLHELARIEPDGARVVELRFFVGMTMEEIATALAMSESTILRRWRLARAWLFKEIQAAA